MALTPPRTAFMALVKERLLPCTTAKQVHQQLETLASLAAAIDTLSEADLVVISREQFEQVNRGGYPLLSYAPPLEADQQKGVA